jgi:RNA polymerase sigma-70 factor (ECF subfamily)
MMPPQDPEMAAWFDAEVRPHEASLRAWLRAKFPRAGDADDLVQESFLRMLRAQAEGSIRNPKAFLFATARNLALDLFRRRRVVQFEPLVGIEDSLVETDSRSCSESLNARQELAILIEAIDALPPRCREIMILQKMHGLSNQQIAERMGISINTVNAQLVIGLARCRRFLAERGVARRKLP